jgi:hypothetical protein
MVEPKLVERAAELELAELTSTPFQVTVAVIAPGGSAEGRTPAPELSERGAMGKIRKRMPMPMASALVQ